MRGRGGIFLALFGAVFFAVGAGMGWFAVHSMLQAERMLQWKACSAVILACELQSHSGDEGSVSYSVHARYEYEVNGVKYQNDRVALSSGSDNIGSFQSDTYRRLEKSRSAGEPVTCWVNPENAADAILIRQPRIPLIMFKALFVLIFGSAGLAISLAGILAALTPDTSAESFMQPRIRMRGASAHKVAVAVAVYWNAFTLWMSGKVLVVVPVAEIPLYFWLLPLSGVIPALIAGYMVLRLNKYGISFFEMSPMPGVLGGPVTGNIRLPKPVAAQAGFDLKLQCIHQYTSRSGKNSTTHQDVLWEDSRRVDTVYNYGTEMVLPVKFAAPYSQPATNTAGNRNGYYWQLKVKAQTSGIDYNAVFDVPVKHTPQSAESYQEEQVSLSSAPGTAGVTLEEVVTGLNLRYERSAEGVVEIGFPPFRAKGVAAGMFVFTVIWTGACWLLVRSSAPRFFAGVFIVFDLIMILGLLSQVFGAAIIRIDPHRQKFYLFKYFAGIAYKTVELAFSELDVFEYERGMQAGSTCYYRVSVNLLSGRSLQLGSALDSRSGAKHLAEELSKLVKRV